MRAGAQAQRADRSRRAPVAPIHALSAETGSTLCGADAQRLTAFEDSDFGSGPVSTKCAACQEAFDSKTWGC